MNQRFEGPWPFLLGDSALVGSEHQAMTGEVMLRTLEAYRPFPSRTLGIAGLRSFNRLCKAFSAPCEPLYALSEDDWQVLVRVMEWTLPRCPWFRQGPAVMDLLESVKEA